MNATQTGTIKFFSLNGYGFIVPDSGGADLFFHATAIDGAQPDCDDRVQIVCGFRRGKAIGPGFPKHPLHKIVCIGALIASRQPEGWCVDALGAPHIGRARGQTDKRFYRKDWRIASATYRIQRSQLRFASFDVTRHW